MKEHWPDRTFAAVNGGFVILLVGIVLYPLIYIVSASVSDPLEVNSGNVWLLPKGLTFEGYARVFENHEIWSGYRNTIGYTLLGTLINLTLTLPCAYALSRTHLSGRHIVLGIMLLTMFIQGGLIPTYLLVKQLGLLDTIWAVMIPNAVSVWNLIIARTFFQSSVPKELTDTAQMDGCTDFRLFFSVVVPLSAPLIAVMALFYGVSHWNQYFGALIYLSDRSLFPLQLILREILILNEMSAEMMMEGESEQLLALAEQAKYADLVKYAVLIVSSLPVILIYPFLQRFFVKGVLVGSIKG